MVESAEADVIGPTVAAKNPVRSLDEEVALPIDLVQQFIFAFRRRRPPATAGLTEAERARVAALLADPGDGADRGGGR